MLYAGQHYSDSALLPGDATLAYERGFCSLHSQAIYDAKWQVQIWSSAASVKYIDLTTSINAVTVY